MQRAIERGRSITVFPSPFFNTEWQADPAFEPFKNTPQSTNLYEGAFAWHWHNRWEQPIEPGSKFQLLESRIDAQLAGDGRVRPLTAAGRRPDRGAASGPSAACI